MLQALGLRDHAGEVLKEGFAAYVACAKEFKLALRNLQARQSRLCCAGQDIRSNDRTDASKRLPNVLQALGLSKHAENFRTRAVAACVAGAREFRRGTRRLRARESRKCCKGSGICRREKTPTEKGLAGSLQALGDSHRRVRSSKQATSKDPAGARALCISA